jgi:heme-degrading monooxygenase HmoA
VIVAISRFAVKNGMEAEVRAAFEDRPRRVETAEGFLGMEVFQDGASFTLLTRWLDEPSYRAWHESPEHHASHALIPRGLKLDPSATQLLVGARIEAATSEGEEGALAIDLATPIARLMRDGATMLVAIVDGDGRLAKANGAFLRLCGAEPIGRPLASLLLEESHHALLEHVAAGAPGPILLQVVPGDGRGASLRVYTRRLAAGFALVGEPPWDDHLALEERLTAITSELSVLARERARAARQLEESHRELDASRWHLDKIGEVLPMCMSCRAVKTAENRWEHAAAYLARSTDFLSHGYCARCASALLEDPDRAP